MNDWNLEVVTKHDIVDLFLGTYLHTLADRRIECVSGTIIPYLKASYEYVLKNDSNGSVLFYWRKINYEKV